MLESELDKYKYKDGKYIDVYDKDKDKDKDSKGILSSDVIL